MVGVSVITTGSKRGASAGRGASSGRDASGGWSHLSPACCSEWVRDGGGVRARDEADNDTDVLYYLGLIDILQVERAFVEHAGKTLTLLKIKHANFWIGVQPWQALGIRLQAKLAGMVSSRPHS